MEEKRCKDPRSRHDNDDEDSDLHISQNTCWEKTNARQGGGEGCHGDRGGDFGDGGDHLTVVVVVVIGVGLFGHGVGDGVVQGEVDTQADG